MRIVRNRLDSIEKQRARRADESVALTLELRALVARDRLRALGLESVGEVDVDAGSCLGHALSSPAECASEVAGTVERGLSTPLQCEQGGVRCRRGWTERDGDGVVAAERAGSASPEGSI